MNYADRPSLLQKPFADTGTKRTVPVDSQIGITDGAASYTDGFPPLTMAPAAGGGIPPAGMDMNGVLYDLSKICQWAQIGLANTAEYGWSYPLFAVVNAPFSGAWRSKVDNNTAYPTADLSKWEPITRYGAKTINLNGVAGVSFISADAYNKQRFILTGTISGDVELQFSSVMDEYLVYVDASGLNLNGHLVYLTTDAFTPTPETLPPNGGWVRVAGGAARNHQSQQRSSKKYTDVTSSPVRIFSTNDAFAQGASFIVVTSANAVWLLASSSTTSHTATTIPIIYTNVSGGYTLEFTRDVDGINARMTATPGPTTYEIQTVHVMGG